MTNNDLLDKGIPSSKPKQDLDTVNGVLAAGIVSVVLSLILWGGLLSLTPLLSGIFAIVKGQQAISLYKDYPNDYTVSSLNRGRAGLICGIIGVSIWGIIRLLVLVVLAA
jgi:hypothetical protein